MKKASLFLVLFFILLSSFASDQNLLRLYNNQQYCNSIERCNKNQSKLYSREELAMKASSYYELFKTPDIACSVKDPLAKCLLTLVRVKKLKSVEPIEWLPELFANAISSGTQTYREAMNLRKWDTALLMIERLKKIESNSLFLIDQARCEYEISKPSALETACSALSLFASDKVKKDETYFLDQTNKVLLNLDSTRNMDFHPLMDSIFEKFQDNEVFAITFLNHWKKDIRKYNSANEFDSMFNTINTIFKYYPDRNDWKDQMNRIVLSIADSLTQDFLDNEENFSSYIKCCNFLMKARISLGDLVRNLQNAKFYSVQSTGDKFQLDNYSISAGTTNLIKFSFDNYTKIVNEIAFDAVVPGVMMQNIKGFNWVDAPKSKRAKTPNDLVKPGTFNYMLLDTLTHLYCNKFRIENKKKPLNWSNAIWRASKHHSLSMACLGSLFHGEKRDSLFGHPDSIDYYLKYDTPKRISAGENCLYATLSENITYNSLAENIIKQWMDSPGHRENMLKEIYESESICTTITNYNGQFAAFLDDATASKYYPEMAQLFNVFPDIKKKLLKPNVIYFSSQNFSVEKME